MDPGREGSDKLMQKDTVLLALLLSSLPQLSSGKQESLAPLPFFSFVFFSLVR
jgi:hypothetical protein